MESVKEGQDPVRLQFTDPETGEVKISDEFEVSAIEQNRTYSMTIYSGGVDQDLVKAVFKDIPEHSDETFTYPVKIKKAPSPFAVRQRRASLPRWRTRQTM